MHSTLLRVAALLSVVNACTNPDTDGCASAFSANLASASAFCATFTTAAVTATTALPDAFASACSYKTSKLSAECACYVTGAATTSSTAKVCQVLTYTNKGSGTEAYRRQLPRRPGPQLALPQPRLPPLPQPQSLEVLIAQ